MFHVCLKESELATLLQPVELCDSHAPHEIQAFVELRKPLNRNVWEYDQDFMTQNDLSIPDSEEETRHVLELWEQAHGANA